MLYYIGFCGASAAQITEFSHSLSANLSPKLAAILINMERVFVSILLSINPNQFSDVILGILTLYVPIGIGFISLKDLTKYKKTLFLEEALKLKTTFWYTVVGLTFFSFYNSTKSTGGSWDPFYKGLAVAVLVYLCVHFWGVFKRLLNFVEDNTKELEVKFLRSLKPSNSERIWDSFFSERQKKYYGGALVEIFVNHLDIVLTHKDYDLFFKLIRTLARDTDNNSKSWELILPNSICWSHTLYLESEYQELDDGPHLFITFANKWVQKYPNGLNFLLQLFYKHVKELPESETEYIKKLSRDFFNILLEKLMNSNQPLGWDYIEANLKIAIEDGQTNFNRLLLDYFIFPAITNINSDSDSIQNPRGIEDAIDSFFSDNSGQVNIYRRWLWAFFLLAYYIPKRSLEIALKQTYPDKMGCSGLTGRMATEKDYTATIILKYYGENKEFNSDIKKIKERLAALDPPTIDAHNLDPTSRTYYDLTSLVDELFRRLNP